MEGGSQREGAGVQKGSERGEWNGHEEAERANWNMKLGLRNNKQHEWSS